MIKALLKVYNVGQGLFTVIRGIRDDGTPYCGIFDCGSIAYNPKFPKHKIIDEVNKLMDDVKATGGMINDIVISHQDADHWSLLENILARYFEMENNVWYRRHLLWCRIQKSEMRLFYRTIIGLLCYNYVFESPSCTQTVEYELCSDNSINSFEYHGEFYDSSCDWFFDVLIPCSFDNSKKTTLTFRLSADTSEPDPGFGFTIEEQTQKAMSLRLMNDCMDALIQKILQYLQEVGRYSRYVEKHLNAMKNLIRKASYNYRDINDFLDSQERSEVQQYIGTVYWGGTEPSSKCRIMQTALMRLCEAHFISDVYFIRSGGFVQFDFNESYCDPDVMSLETYEMDLLCADEGGKDSLAIKRNVTSAVTYLELTPEIRCLLPGDITVHGFRKLSQVINGLGEQYKTSILLAPHHGSDITNFTNDENNQPIIDLLNAFLKDGYRGVVVSAYASAYGHPGSGFMKIVENYCSHGEPEHVICCGDGKKCHPFGDLTDLSLYCTETLDQIAFDMEFPVRQGRLRTQRQEVKKEAYVSYKTPSKRLFL